MLLLALLIFSRVEVDSKAWQNFVTRTLLSSSSVKERFCDDILPFKDYERVDEFFGDNEDHGAIIFRKQSIVCVPTLSKDLKIVDNANLVRLPYLREKLLEMTGTHGQLFEVEIAPGHIDGKRQLVRKDIPRDAPLEMAIGRQLEKNR